MALPVSSSTAATVAATTATTATTTAATSAGVSSTGSSISSAAASLGFCDTIKSYFDWMVEAIRSCLANLPLIGGWFASASTSATSTAGTSSTSAVTTDADCVRNIAAVFVPASAVSAATSAPAITPAIVQYCTNLFGQIQSPVAKMQAFAAVQNAVNSTDAIVKEFYDALPAAEQEGFKLAMYNKNQADTGNGSVRNGHDHGLGFGDYMVYHEIKTDLAKEGAIAYIAALQAAASSTATSTTGTV